MTASDVPCAWCCVAPKRRVSRGIRTMPPPTPKRPPASPATTPPRTAWRRSAPCIRLVGLRARGGSALDETDHVGKARRRSRSAEHDRDHVAALGVDPGGQAIPGFGDEAGLARSNVVVTVEE